MSEDRQEVHVSEVCVGCGRSDGELRAVEGYRGRYLLCPECLDPEEDEE